MPTLLEETRDLVAAAGPLTDPRPAADRSPRQRATPDLLQVDHLLPPGREQVVMTGANPDGTTGQPSLVAERGAGLGAWRAPAGPMAPRWGPPA